MNEILTTILANKYVQGAIAGLIAAAWVDFRAFQSFKTLDDFAKYDWKVAGMRWLQGAIGGALAAAGIGAIS